MRRPFGEIYRRFLARSRHGAPGSRGELLTVGAVVVLSLVSSIFALAYDNGNSVAVVVINVILALISIISVSLLIVAYFDRSSKYAAARAALENIREYERYAPASSDQIDTEYLEDVARMAAGTRIHVANMMASGNRGLGFEISHSLANFLDALTAERSEVPSGSDVKRIDS